MTTVADSIRALVLAQLPTGWRVQFGRWIDSEDKTYRYVVIRPAGGAKAELLRYPQHTVAVIGGSGDASTFVAAAAEQLVAAIRAATGDLPHFEAGEPVFMATDDGRTVFEIAVSAITD